MIRDNIIINNWRFVIAVYGCFVLIESIVENDGARAGVDSVSCISENSIVVDSRGTCSTNENTILSIFKQRIVFNCRIAHANEDSSVFC